MSRVTARFIVFGTNVDQVNAQLIPANYTAVNYTPVQVGSEGTNKISSHLKGIDQSFLPKAGGTMTGRLFLPDGTAALPALSFTSANTSGLYFAGTNAIGISTNGVLRVTVDTANLTTTLPILAPVGAVGGPSYSFSGDATTGIYHPGASQVAVTIAGVQVLLVGAALVQSLQPFIGPVGSNSAPTFAFAGDQTTGVYHSAASTVAIGTAGTLRFSVSTTAVTSTLPFLAPAGTKAAPSHSFSGDVASGLYSPASGQLGLSASNTLMLWMSNASLVTGPTASGVFRLTNAGGAVTTHMLIDPALSLASGSSYAFDATSGFVFARSNGSLRIARSAIQLCDTSDVAGAEQGGLAFFIQAPGGAAMAEGWRMNSSGQFMIGTIYPNTATSKFTVSTNVATTSLNTFRNFDSTGANNSAVISIVRGRGTDVACTPPLAGDRIGNWNYVGVATAGTIGTTATVVNAASMQVFAEENFSATASGSYMSFATGTTASGVGGPVERMRLNGSGRMNLSCGLELTTVNTIAVSGTYAVLDRDLYLLVDTTAARQITLPPPAQRRIIYIKDSTGTAETNNITIVPNAGEQIEGLAANKLLETNWGSWTFVSNGTNWFMF